MHNPPWPPEEGGFSVGGTFTGRFPSHERATIFEHIEETQVASNHLAQCRQRVAAHPQDYEAMVALQDAERSLLAAAQKARHQLKVV